MLMVFNTLHPRSLPTTQKTPQHSNIRAACFAKNTYMAHLQPYKIGFTIVYNEICSNHLLATIKLLSIEVAFT